MTSFSNNTSKLEDQLNNAQDSLDSKELCCACSHITRKDVEQFIELYPKLSSTEIENCLNIGQGCGNCIHTNDQYFLSVQEILENIYD